MKFKCERDTLISALSRAGRAVTTKVGPVVGLSGVLLELSGDSLSVTGSDVDLTISDRITVSGGENGAALVQARLLTDIVRSLDLGAVEVEFDDQVLTVRAGRSEFSLRTMPASDFPRIPLLGEATVTVDGEALVGGLRQVVSAAGRDESRPVLPGVVDAARRILKAIPGLTLVDLDVPRVGTMSNSLSVLPAFKSKLREREFEQAEAAGVDTLATIFHACHREICHYESGRSFEILNFMELVGESLGFRHEDVYKRLKLMQDVDAIVRDAGELIERHSLDLEQVRDVIYTDMVSGKSVGVSPIAGARPG